MDRTKRAQAATRSGDVSGTVWPPVSVASSDPSWMVTDPPEDPNRVSTGSNAGSGVSIAAGLATS